MTLTSGLLTALMMSALPASAVQEGGRISQADRVPKLELHFPAGKSMVEVPFRFQWGMIVVDVRVNGSKPIGFILESGWSQYGFVKPEKVRGLERRKSDGLAFGVRLDIGALRLEGAGLEVAGDESLGQLGKLPEDGILGGQFLKSVVVEVDWRTRRVRLHDPSRFEAPEGVQVLPLRIRSSGHIFVTAEITVDAETRPVELLVDTGGAHALFVRSDRVPLPVEREKNLTLGRGIFGEVKGDRGHIDELLLGDVPIEDVATNFLDQNSKRITVGSDGNLGNEILRRFVVTFDYSRKRLLLKPTDAIGEPFDFSPGKSR